MASVQTCTTATKTRSTPRGECNGRIHCKVVKCMDGEFHVTVELRTDGAYITNVPYNNVTPRIETPAKVISINGENVECDMTAFRSTMANLKNHESHDVIVEGRLKSNLKRKQHAGRRKSKRKRDDSRHVKFDLTKNKTKVVERYIMSEQRARHILCNFLMRQRIQAAFTIQRAYRRAKRMRAASTIQRAYRRAKRMRAASTIQRAYRNKMKLIPNCARAASTIQRAYRHTYRHTYRNKMSLIEMRARAASTIQRLVRRWSRRMNLWSMLKRNHYLLNEYYAIGFTDAELQRYVVFRNGKASTTRGKPTLKRTLQLRATKKRSYSISEMQKKERHETCEARKKYRSDMLKKQRAKSRKAKAKEKADAKEAERQAKAKAKADLKKTREENAVINKLTNNQIKRIDTLSNTMKTFSDSAEIQIHACDAFCRRKGFGRNRLSDAEACIIDDIINAMKVHADDANVQMSACKALWGLAFQNDDNQDRIANSGGIEAIVKAMKAHKSTIEIQETACIALKDIGCRDENKDKLVCAGSVKAILTAMKTYPKSVEVQVQACDALCILDKVEEIVTTGGIKTIIAAMKTHPDVFILQRHACKTLRNIAIDKTYLAELFDARNIETIIAAMKTHLSKADLQLYGCEILGIRFEYNTAGAEADSIEVIAAAMKRHPLCTKLQQKACWALVNVACNGVSADEVKLFDTNGIELVVLAMKTHPICEDLQNGACRFLNILSENYTNKVKISKAGGIEALLSVMKKRTFSSEKHKIACMTLRKMAYTTDSIIKITELGGVDVLIACMNFHFLVGDIQEHACWVLGNLAVNDATRAKISKAEGIEVILRAMKYHLTNASVQTRACAALWALAFQNDDNKIKIANKDGINLILKAMKTHRSSVQVQIEACGSLWNLAWNVVNKVKIARANGINAIITAMKTHQTDTELQKRACGALGNLAVQNESNKVKIAREGGINAIITAMKSHVYMADIQEKACWALRNMGTINEKSILENGGLDLVLLAMKTHRYEADLQQTACLMLKSLTCNGGETKKNIADTDGIDLILKAMKTHRDVVKLQHIACMVLLNLAANNRKNQRAVGEAGIELIVTAMNVHRTVASLQCTACNLLSNLTPRAPDRKKLINKLGGIEAILMAMKVHADDADLQNQACGTLWCLAWDEGNTAKIVESGGIELVMKAIVTHFPKVKGYGHMALESIVHPHSAIGRATSRIQKVVRRHQAKKRYLKLGEQIRQAIHAVQTTDRAILAMQKTKNDAIPATPLEPVDACIQAYQKYIQDSNAIIKTCQSKQNYLVTSFPRLLDNMVSSDENIENAFRFQKHFQVLRWFAQTFYRFRTKDGAKGTYWSGIGTRFDALDYHVSINLAILYAQFESSGVKMFYDMQCYINGQQPSKLSYPVIEKKQFKALLATMKSVTLSNTSTNCTVHFNLSHVEQEVTSIARRLKISYYCFANIDYLRQRAKSSPSKRDGVVIIPDESSDKLKLLTIKTVHGRGDKFTQLGDDYIEGCGQKLRIRAVNGVELHFNQPVTQGQKKDKKMLFLSRNKSKNIHFEYGGVDYNGVIWGKLTAALKRKRSTEEDTGKNEQKNTKARL